jgi:hypothetical protein
MSGRRSHARFVVASNDGVLQVARDVSVVSCERELVAISREPETIGDALTLEMIVDGHVEQVAVRVSGSQPIVDAGSIRYRIQLARVDPGGGSSDDTLIQSSRWKTGRSLQ